MAVFKRTFPASLLSLPQEVLLLVPLDASSLVSIINVCRLLRKLYWDLLPTNVADILASIMHEDRIVLFDYICRIGFTIPNPMHLAAKYDAFKIIQALYERKHRVNSQVCNNAAASGSTRILKWIVKISKGSCPWKSEVYTHATNNGHLNVIKFCSHRTSKMWPNVPISVRYDAARFGHLHILKWLYKRDPNNWHSSCYDKAASGGHLNVLIWLSQRNIPCVPRNICIHAAYGGHLHILQYLKAQGHDLTGYIYVNAAEHGHLHVMKWAHEQAYPWNIMNHLGNDGHCIISGYIGKRGDLSMLQWVMDNKLELDQDDLIVQAIINRQLDMLKWLNENGYMLRAFVIEIANSYNKSEIITWLQSMNES